MTDKDFDQDIDQAALMKQIASQIRQSVRGVQTALNQLSPEEELGKDPQRDKSMAQLRQSYYRLLRLANNLSDGGEPGLPPTVHKTNLDLVALCRCVTDAAREGAELLGLKLTFLTERKRCILALDRDRIERLLWNLLSNAFKFTPAGGNVTLELQVKDGKVLLSLSDTGSGISPEQLEKVFCRFRQPNRLEPSAHGLGLGLAICKQIAEDHDGCILLCPRQEGGTMVAVSLPEKRLKHTELRVFALDYSGGINRALLELSDALPWQAFLR